jgi:hypothetical protein
MTEKVKNWLTEKKGGLNGKERAHQRINGKDYKKGKIGKK